MDIRPQLYDRYVSDFKSENAALTSAELSHYYKWCDARYLPHLKNIPPSANILELGCGHGRILSYLREKGFTNVKGIDISQEQIDLARNTGLDAECVDVFEYFSHTNPLLSKEGAGGGLDCVIAIDLIEHFTKSEALRLLEAVRAAMNPGALLLLQTPNAEGLFARQVIYGDLTHETIFSPGSLAQLLRTAGLRNIHSYECAPVPRGMAGVLRAIAWKMIRVAANTIRRIESHKSQAVWTENFVCVAHA